MNKYLEKVAELDKQALNALKAREMAAKVGVIADPRSNWKYALRNLRDAQGNPLQGRELQEGWKRLAGGRDTQREYQQMSALARKARGIDEVQQVSASGKEIFPKTLLHGQGALHHTEMNSPIHGKGLGAFIENVQPLVNHRNTAGLSIAHTHPNRADTPFLKRIASHESRGDSPGEYLGRLVGGGRIGNVMPSGTTTQQEAFRHMSKPLRRKVYTDDANLGKMMQELPGVEKQDSGALERLYEHLGEYNEQTSKMTGMLRNARMGPQQGDSALFGSVYQGKVNPIYAPGQHIVGLHKSVQDAKTGIPVSHRSIYRDLTPRASKQ